MAIHAVGDFSPNNFGQWVSIQDPARSGGGGRITILSSGTRKGPRCARFEVRSGDQWNKTSGERAEVSDIRRPNSTNNFRVSNGQEHFLAFSTKFESLSGFTNWGTFCQWHSNSSTGLGPALGLYFQGGNTSQIRAVINPVSSSSANSAGINRVIYGDVGKTMNVWHDFVFQVRWTCGNNGLWKVWHKLANESDYKLLLDHKGRTLQNHNGCQGAYWKMGWYRASANKGTNSVCHSGMVVADTFKEVSEFAHGSLNQVEETKETHKDEPIKETHEPTKSPSESTQEDFDISAVRGRRNLRSAPRRR